MGGADGQNETAPKTIAIARNTNMPPHPIAREAACFDDGLSFMLFKYQSDDRFSIAHALTAGPDPSALQFSLSCEMASEVGSITAKATVKETANDLILCGADSISLIVACTKINVAPPICIRLPAIDLTRLLGVRKKARV